MEEWNENKVSPMALITPIVRFIGIIVIIIGIIISFMILSEAWALFESPKSISNFSQNIEKESGINKFLNSFIQNSFNEIHSVNANLADLKPSEEKPEKQKEQENKNVKMEQLDAAYFISWSIKILMLLIIGKIALWMLTTGASMATKESNNKEVIAQTVAAVFQELDKRNGRI